MGSHFKALFDGVLVGRSWTGLQPEKARQIQTLSLLSTFDALEGVDELPEEFELQLVRLDASGIADPAVVADGDEGRREVGRATAARWRLGRPLGRYPLPLALVVVWESAKALFLTTRQEINKVSATTLMAAKLVLVI